MWSNIRRIKNNLEITKILFKFVRVNVCLTKRRKVMYMDEEYVKIWKKHKITHAEFSFDSLSDVEDDITFYRGDKIIKEKWGLSSYLIDDIFQYVDFLEESDRYYTGERGTVTIELCEEDEDEPFFQYAKSSKYLRSDWRGEEILCEITKEQAQFLEEYVSDMSGGEDGREVNYKKDFILTEKIEEMIEELYDNFEERCHGWADDLICTKEDVEELYNADFSYETGDITITEKTRKFYVNLNVSYEFMIEE